MKKAISIILIILPVFLMVSISLAARVIFLLVPVSVNGIEFIDEKGEMINRLTMGLDEKVFLSARVLPEDASNKNLYFEIGDTDVCELGAEGELTALKYGYCTVYAVADEKDFRAELTVEVSDTDVDKVILDVVEKTLNISERFKLTAEVLPYTALNRKVTWTSSDSKIVSVNSTGLIIALAATEPDNPVIITVISDDGGKTAECVVTVLPTLPPIAFYRPDELLPLPHGSTLVVSEQSIDLMDYLQFDKQLIDANDIVFEISNGSEFGRLEGSILTFLQPGKAVRIRVIAVSKDGGETFEWESPFRRR